MLTLLLHLSNRVRTSASCITRTYCSSVITSTAHSKMARTISIPLSSPEGSPVKVTYDSVAADYDDLFPIHSSLKSKFNASPARVDDPVNGLQFHSNQNGLDVYVLKGELLRIYSQSTDLKGLVRGHAGQTITDVQFFHGDNCFASVGAPTDTCEYSTLLITDARASSTLETTTRLQMNSDKYVIQRIVWHPFNPSVRFKIKELASRSCVDVQQFCLLCKDTQGMRIAILVQSERFVGSTTVALEDFLEQRPPMVRGADSDVNDMAWNPHAERYLLMAYENGNVSLVDWKKGTLIEDENRPAVVETVDCDGPASTCMFLPHTQAVRGENEATTPCFLTASDKNAVITLWTPFSSEGSKPLKLQVFGAAHNSASSYVLGICGTAKDCFVVQGHRTEGRVNVWRLSSDEEECLQGCDRLIPYRCKYPFHSWQIKMASEVTGYDAEYEGRLTFDVEAVAVQPHALMKYSFKRDELLLEPGKDSPSELSIETLEDMSARPTSAPLQYDENDFEDYEVEDDDDDVEDYDAPDPASIPAPQMSSGTGFTNWLGALAAKTTPDLPAPIVDSTRSANPLKAAETISNDIYADPAIISDPTIVSGPAVIAAAISQAGRQPTPPHSNRSEKKSKQKSKSQSPVALTTSETALSEVAGVSSDHIRRIVREEIKKLQPTIEQRIEQVLQSSISGGNILIDPTTVTQAVEAPLKLAIADNMRHAILPAMESIMGQVLSSVSTQLSTNDSSTKEVASRKDLETVASQLVSMNQQLNQIQSEMKSFKSQLQVSSRSAAPSQPTPTGPQIVADVQQKFQAGRIQEGFYICLNAKSYEVTVACCAKLKPMQVLDDSPKIDQNTMVCLLQQLSMAVSKSSNDQELSVALEWITELALSFSPVNEQVRDILRQTIEFTSRSFLARLEKRDLPNRERELNRVLQIVRGIRV